MKWIETIDSNEERIKIEELYKKYRGLMVYVAIDILKDKDLAEDVLSDAIIKIIRHRKKIFELNCYQERLYIVNTIKTTSYDLLKKMNNNIADEIDDMFAIVTDSDNTVLDDIIAKEGYDRIKEVIKTLPAILKDVAHLNLIYELSHEEISMILDISKAASKMRLVRAKKIIRKALRGDKNG